MKGEASEAARASLEALEAALGHRFSNRALLDEALRHASYANEHPGLCSNDRLEFLGDAVVGLVAAQLLFEANSDWDEGALTRGLHQIVDRRGLSALARRLGIGAHLLLGTTEQQSRGHEKKSILADAMEALIGAMYLDAGLEPVRALVRREFEASLAAGAEPAERDPKTRFQELVMARHGEFPRYALVSDTGIEGDEARFTIAAFVLEERISEGVGRSKRAAEFAAAERALERLDGESEATATGSASHG